VLGESRVVVVDEAQLERARPRIENKYAHLIRRVQSAGRRAAALAPAAAGVGFADAAMRGNRQVSSH